MKTEQSHWYFLIQGESLKHYSICENIKKSDSIELAATNSQHDSTALHVIGNDHVELPSRS